MMDVFNENPFGDFEQFTRFYGSLEENHFYVECFNLISFNVMHVTIFVQKIVVLPPF